MVQTQTARRLAAPPQPTTALSGAAQETGVARSVGAVGLSAIGLIHLLDAPGKYSETPYMFWMYLALIAGCLGGAALLLRGNSRQGWMAAAALSAMPFIGYVLSRTTGLPGAMDDIGNWTESLGLASLFVEACVFAVSLAMLARLRALAVRRPRAAGWHRTA
jgi:hypothetical protein